MHRRRRAPLPVSADLPFPEIIVTDHTAPGHCIFEYGGEVVEVLVVTSEAPRVGS